MRVMLGSRRWGGMMGFFAPVSLGTDNVDLAAAEPRSPHLCYQRMREEVSNVSQH